MTIESTNLIHSAVIMIVDKFDRVLMLKNNEKKKLANVWVFPGGKCDLIDDEGRMETHHEAIVRELREETGLTAIIFSDTPFTISYGGALVRVFVAMREDLLSDEVILSPEHTEYKWVEPGDIKDMVIAPGASRLLAKKANFRKN